MASEGKSHLEKISSGFKNVQGLLRGRNLPGTVRLSRQEPEVPRFATSSPHRSDGPDERKNVESDGQIQRSMSAQLGRVEHMQMEGFPKPNAANGMEQDGTQVEDGSDATTSSSTMRDVEPSRSNSSIVYGKFQRIINADMAIQWSQIDIEELRKVSWTGIPPRLRPTCWRLLFGYTPPNRERQESVLSRKRGEYQNMVRQFYDIANSERSEEEIGALRQVAVDVPRTAPGVPFFQHPVVQKSLERILYLWGIRHPASGYVQGINDLVTPFLAVFTSENFPGGLTNWDDWDLDGLSEDVVLNVEADCYWCLCKLLDGIQDHYTSAQPGIQRTVFKVKEVVRWLDPKLTYHFENQGVDFLQFAFRWVNCLLLREFPFRLIPRLWDTYIAEGGGGTRFSEFLAHACAAFLVRWQNLLKGMEFQDIIMFLQKVPTGHWTEKDVELILSQSFMNQELYGKAKEKENETQLEG